MKDRINNLYSFTFGFLFAAILFAVFLVSINLVLAAWQEPTLPPPSGNVAPPLNTGATNQYKSGGLSLGGVATTTKLCFGNIGNDCKSSWSDVLGVWKPGTGGNGIFYDGKNVGIGDAIAGLPTWPLFFARLAINTGSAEGLYISRDSAVPYSYINVRDSADKSIFKVHESGKVGIGIDTPNKDLHIYNTAANAEIDLQSVAGNGEHWGIYNDKTTNDLRFWKNAVDRVKFSSVGIVTAADFCTDGGKCLAASVVTAFAGLATKSGEYNGLQSGYTGINTVCNTQFTGSHVCGADEMLVIARNPSSLNGTSGYAWINTGSAGFKDNLMVNDCSGWTSNSNSAIGSIWNFNLASTNGGSVMLSQCNAARKIACCF